jgi:hypothetical protein
VDPGNILFWQTTYRFGSWNPWGEVFDLNPNAVQQSGYLLRLGAALGELPLGPYTFTATPAEPAGAEPIVSTASLPDVRALEPVASDTMQAQWVEANGQQYLQLSWAPVSDAPDRYQVMFINPETGRDIFYAAVPLVVPPAPPPPGGSVPYGWPWMRLGTDVLAEIAAVTGGPLPAVNWIVQTRVYDGPSNYARGHSNPVYVSLEAPPPPEPPVNDLFANATLVDPVPFTDTVDTRYATIDPDDIPQCNDPYGGVLKGTVWYAYTPAADVLVNANTYGSSFWPNMNVVQGAPGAFELVACGGGEVSFPAAAGQTYYFLVGTPEWSLDNGGNLVFYLTAVEPLSIGLNLDPVGSFDRVSGAAILTGTVTCNRPVEISLNGTVRQTVGRLNVIEAEIYGSVLCDGVTPWRVMGLSPSGSFGGGAAYVRLYASGWEPGTGQYDSAQITDVVSLRKPAKSRR